MKKAFLLMPLLILSLSGCGSDFKPILIEDKYGAIFTIQEDILNRGQKSSVTTKLASYNKDETIVQGKQEVQFGASYVDSTLSIKDNLLYKKTEIDNQIGKKIGDDVKIDDEQKKISEEFVRLDEKDFGYAIKNDKEFKDLSGDYKFELSKSKFSKEIIDTAHQRMKDYFKKNSAYIISTLPEDSFKTIQEKLNLEEEDPINCKVRVYKLEEDKQYRVECSSIIKGVQEKYIYEFTNGDITRKETTKTIRTKKSETETSVYTEYSNYTYEYDNNTLNYPDTRTFIELPEKQILKFGLMNMAFEGLVK